MPKLREYKGVTYREGRWRYDQCIYAMVSALIADFRDTFTDADHAALMDLKNNPHEPIQTLEDIIDQWSRNTFGVWTQIRDDLCKRIREAFPDIDKEAFEPIQTLEEQIQYHVDALVDMGAKYYSGEHPFMEGYPRLVLPKVK